MLPSCIPAHLGVEWPRDRRCQITARIIPGTTSPKLHHFATNSKPLYHFATTSPKRHYFTTTLQPIRHHFTATSPFRQQFTATSPPRHFAAFQLLHHLTANSPPLHHFINNLFFCVRICNITFKFSHVLLESYEPKRVVLAHGSLLPQSAHFSISWYPTRPIQYSPALNLSTSYSPALHLSTTYSPVHSSIHRHSTCPFHIHRQTTCPLYIHWQPTCPLKYSLTPHLSN
jgi:hypothetical protein